MNLQTDASVRLLTWLDVERLLKKRTALWTQMPVGVQSVDCFASGVEIRHSAPIDQVDEWLLNVFGSLYQRQPRSVCLRIGDTLYPVELIQSVESAAPSSGKNYPLWRDVAYLPTGEEESGDISAQPLTSLLQDAPTAWNSSPSLVSFHSFKGGVGRTTALMTYVAACMQEPGPGPKRILVVDADLEAPGVSFWLDEVNRPTVSFAQFLEALHYPPAGLDATLDFFAQELRKTSIGVGGLQRELFILPAALDLTEIEDMPVAPEHLARSSVNRWQLADHLHALGLRLGADVVFIDLRAGLSELASPILFDPRVDHFFVSTVAPQSVQGMAEVLRRLCAFNRQIPAEQQKDARPTVVLSLLTNDLRNSAHYELALKTLNAAYPTDDVLNPGMQWLEAEFLSTLMSIGTVREALDALPQSGRLFASAREWADSLYATPPSILPIATTQDASTEINLSQQQAKRLRAVCVSAEFADGSAPGKILATEPLLNLGKHYTNELPNLLMIGAKGAGKTFTFRQLVGVGTWQGFLSKLGFDQASTTSAAIFPALWSDNIEDKPNGEIKLAQRRAINLTQGDEHQLLDASAVRRLIKEALKTPPDNWEDFWDSLIARQFGISDGGLRAVNQCLSTHSARVVFVFDGIEDAFKDTNEDHAIDAIHALLRLPNRISELDNRCLGTIVFVRADYVQATIRQNLGQWLQRFQPFRLRWNPESFLRLAFMLSCQAGIHQEDPKSAESLRIDELKIKLERLWGKKLGGEKSKEAYSARWVYTALCDLKGNVQARDLVRFLKFAAGIEETRTGQPWQDRRVLAPESMRKAIPECSIEKVNEAKSEIAPLKKWTDLMTDQGIRKLKVPFSQEQAGLTPDLLRSLQEIGVIYEDVDGNLGDERLFLPEIYRSGLGFDTSAAGRPRTQALLKKNIGSIPL